MRILLALEEDFPSGDRRRSVALDRVGKMHGVKAAVDEDLAAALLARRLDADLMAMLTEVEPRVSTMRAARRFAEATGRRAAIGSLTEAAQVVQGAAGTQLQAAAAEPTIAATRYARPVSVEGKTRVVLADDHAVVRSALKALLEGQEDLEVVGEAGSIAEARETVGEQAPAVLVLDVNLPDGLAVDAVPDLREEAPETQIVLLTMERDLTLARRALDAGACGYLFKDSAHLELIEAVRAAAKGEHHLPAAVAAGLKGEDGAEGRPTLSPRETDVLKLMALGHTNREIGEHLALSVRTVETHRAHIQQKLGLSSRPELTRYALANGLIDA